MKSLTDRILSVLRDECRLTPDDLITVGVSGGIDSMFLLVQLYEMKLPLIAAVFNHGLRPEAADECRFVLDFCRQKGIPCICGEADVHGYAADKGLGIEEAARQLRYRFLFDTAVQNKAAAVATAHHADDQAETVLLHLLRGSGIDGLGGIRPYSLPNAFSETIPLIRPLLGITRAEIEAFAAETGMPFREDRSNTDTAYTRNRIRHDLIPGLKAEYNPQIVQALCRLAESAAADSEVLEAERESAGKYMSLRFRENGAEWSRKTYQSYRPGLRMRLLRSIFSKLGADVSEIGYSNLKESDKFFINARYNQTIPLMSGIYLRCEGDKAQILNNIKINQWKYPQVSQGWELVTEIRAADPRDLRLWQEKARQHPEMAILDASLAASDPYLRRIRAGERFQPYGNRGHSQKMSDFLINCKIPKEYRPDLAVAADAEGIIWVPGLRVAQRCAISEQTKRIMILKLKKEQTGSGHLEE